MLNKKCLLILILCSLNVILGQTLELPKSIQSPNASSLGRYGDIPINYYSGRVDVNVPLFSCVENGIPFNIDLNYDSGGVRVNDLPSWIGQNWNMNAGGVIVRNQRGWATDEYSYPQSNPQPTFYGQGFLSNLNKLNPTNWTDYTYLRDLVASEPMKDDLEPDIFTFNFMGFTGSFFLMSDGTWKVQSSKNVKVIINLADRVPLLGRNTIYPWNDIPSSAPKGIGKITLIDDSGNQYIFGETQAAIEYSQRDFFNYYRGVTANAWYLTTVKDRLNNTIYSFEYERGDFQANFYLSYKMTTREKSNNGTFWQPGGGCLYSDDFPFLYINGVINFPSYLKKIISRNGTTIDFSRSNSAYRKYDFFSGILRNSFDKIYSPYRNNSAAFDSFLEYNMYLFFHDQNEKILYANMNWVPYLDSKIKNSKLDQITIKKNGIVFKTINLTRNWDKSERLNLAGVDMLEGDSTIPMSYKFYYNNFNQLPDYLSYAIDHWGFYKGTNSLYPGTFFNESEYYNSREPNSSTLNIGSLYRITYPTKGFSIFEYEPHSYSKYVDQNLELANESKIAGGLRIKKITTYDGLTLNSNIKEIKYTETPSSTISTGILALKNRYHCSNWQVRTHFYNSLYQESVFSMNTIIQGSNFSGSHIGYSKVHEINNTNGGYTTYEYTNYADYKDIPYTSTISVSHSVFDAHNSNDFKRGLLKSKKYYDNSNLLLPIRTEENFYNTIGLKKTARGLNYNQFQPCELVADGVLLGNAYEIEYSDFKLTSSVETDYFSGNPVTRTTNYTNIQYPVDSSFFGNTFLRTEETVLPVGSSSFSSNLKTYNYPFDFSGTVEMEMVNKHYFPVEETILKRSAEPISKTKNIFSLQTLNSLQVPMLTSTQKAKGPGSYENDMIVDKYDADGNILQYHKSNGVNISFIWNANLLMFKVENATWNEFTSTTDFNTFNNSNPDKLVTKYTYNTLRNIESITYPNGIMEKYTYDNSNRLQKISDQNNKIIKTFIYNIK